MSSYYHLYCAQTQEAVEVMRRGVDGLQTPEGSPKALFAFMSYHLSKDHTFTLMQLDEIGNHGEDVYFVYSLDELNKEREFYAAMSGKVTLILIWGEAAVDELLGRDIKQLNAIANFNFPEPKISR